MWRMFLTLSPSEGFCHKRYTARNGEQLPRHCRVCGQARRNNRIAAYMVALDRVAFAIKLRPEIYPSAAARWRGSPGDLEE
jgi:hypothetical protein